jgi:hypothetical protein
MKRIACLVAVVVFVCTANRSSAQHPGDYDYDGDVDGADYVAWQTAFPWSSAPIWPLPDGDGNGKVDGADFIIWQTNFPYIPTAASLIPGDFDGNDKVDGADFIIWQTNAPRVNPTLATGDADGDGDVDGADFVVWQTNFPYPPSPATVPEPSTIALALLSVPAIFALRRRLR